MARAASWFLTTAAFAVFACAAAAQSSLPPTHTQVVVLGTGTPEPYPDRSGPAVAIVVNGAAYLVDCGPGVVRRAEAAEQNGIKALNVKNLKMVFITHLHSDHTLGYPDLIFSPWVLHRKLPLQAYGPRGLRRMTDHILKAWQEDIRVRTTGLEEADRTGYKVEVHEISPGLVYQDQNVKVTAFPVKHGSWKQAFGYRFETQDRSIVLSGDTATTDTVVNACNGCDVLLHEVYNVKGAEMREEHWKEYFASFHTSPQQLGEIATRAHPKLLVLYHQVLEHLPEQDLVEQVRQHYKGQVVSARDLGVY
ncbi:MAG TPA: MBL fold metallo-hydrolase [Terriglobales bacterium]|nr:MBL fold metallo-hydrolase [Terriglobales bacterium]